MLDSARVIPAAPLKAGFEFRYPEIGEALRDLVA
jgi:NAD dependent epimerase/dehydratase family enzyme